MKATIKQVILRISIYLYSKNNRIEGMQIMSQHGKVSQMSVSVEILTLDPEH